jgi:hypothetical protein
MMKSVHLTKIAARLAKVTERLSVHPVTSSWMKEEYDLPRLLVTDVPELIQAVKDAKAETAEMRRQLTRIQEAGARYQVTVYSDSPMKLSQIGREQGDVSDAG